MLTLKKVAVTGGIAMGKTLVCRMLQEFGAYVVNADQIVHQSLSENTSLIKNVTALLGTDIFVDGAIDRKKIAEKVFSDDTQESEKTLKALEGMIHPIVQKEIDAEWTSALRKGYRLFVVEIPLLFEKGLSEQYDEVVSVISDEKKAIQRFCKRPGMSQKEYFRRMRYQYSAEKKAALSTYIIENNASKALLKKKTKKLFITLTADDTDPV